MSSKLNTIVEEIKSLNIMEVAELVSMLQETFGVSAASMAAPSASSSSEAPKEEKSIFKVELVDSGSDKMKVIKALRAVKKELGLMEAKAATENLPFLIFADANKVDAENAKKSLEEVGAKVKLS